MLVDISAVSGPRLYSSLPNPALSSISPLPDRKDSASDTAWAYSPCDTPTPATHNYRTPDNTVASTQTSSTMTQYDGLYRTTSWCYLQRHHARAGEGGVKVNTAIGK